MAAGAEPLVVWINGAFGVGKTAVAKALTPLLVGSILLDPELFGSALERVVPPAERTDDFQDVPAWRELTRRAATALATAPPRVVIVPMTLVDDGYFEEIVEGIRADGVPVIHITLVAPVGVIGDRLRSRSANEDWGLERVERCVAALAEVRFASRLDASTASPRALALEVSRLVMQHRIGGPV